MSNTISFIVFFGTPDVDECCSNNTICHVNAVCSNTPESYICTCSEGFEASGTDCKGMSIIAIEFISYFIFLNLHFCICSYCTCKSSQPV